MLLRYALNGCSAVGVLSPKCESMNPIGCRFNTIGVSDGMSMGTDGMSFSLQSRDIIADSIETVMSAQWYDANISLPGALTGTRA